MSHVVFPVADFCTALKNELCFENLNQRKIATIGFIADEVSSVFFFDVVINNLIKCDLIPAADVSSAEEVLSKNLCRFKNTALVSKILQPSLD